MQTDTGSFEFIDHTADLAVRARQPICRDCSFRQPAACTPCSASCTRARSQSVEITIEAHAPDVESLLHDWLAELLWQIDSQKCLFEHFHFTRFDPQHLAAHCKGTIYDAAASERSVEIKAVTYHDLRIEKRQELYEVTVVFDI